MQFERPLDSIKDYTLILPSVSVGNVGQLAQDVLLASLSPPPDLLGQVHHPALIPMVGCDPLDNDSSSITTAMQMYQYKPSRLLLLQIRSGIVPGKGDLFLDDLVSWCKEKGVSRLISLTSCHAHEMTDSQIRSSPLRYLATPTCQVGVAGTRLEQRGAEPAFLPGGGVAKRLYDKCVDNDVECVVLLKFCSEGDNTSDGLMLADYLNQWLNLIPEKPAQEKYKVPHSWRLLFGNPNPVEMYW